MKLSNDVEKYEFEVTSCNGSKLATFSSVKRTSHNIKEGKFYKPCLLTMYHSSSIVHVCLFRLGTHDRLEVVGCILAE